MFEMLTLGADAGEIAPLGMFVVAVVWIIAGYSSSTTKTKSREESRREIAAYVAEGTISPDDAVRLINAGRPAHEIAKSAKA